MLLATVACSPDGNTPDGIKDSVTIAKVNEEGISIGEFRKSIEKNKRKYRVDSSEPVDSDSYLWLKTDALNGLIQKTLFKQEAKKRDISLTAEETADFIRQAKDGYSEDTFNKYLGIEDITEEEWENDLKNNLLIKKLIDEQVNSKVSVNEEELRQYFEEHEVEFHKGKQVKALHIMVETEEEALAIKKQLDSDARDFSDLARELSLGPEGAEGGDLGYLEQGHMPAELEDIFKLKVGEVSNVIRTPYGSHIFKVVDKKKDQKMSFEESKKIIHDKLLRERQDTAFHAWLSELKEKANIEIEHEVLAKVS
ncbi:MAG: peptidylprolyl isomerase [Nitrospinaceae bacterium]|nr:MAG: peptidylprolyl isomerase [Nitrospinaceae bacterium]